MVKRVIEEELTGFPDLHVTIEDIVAEDDKVWVRLTETATHTGPSRGLRPTGQTITYTAVTIWRIASRSASDTCVPPFPPAIAFCSTSARSTLGRII